MANYEVLEPDGHAALIDGLKDYTDREGGVGAKQIADGSVNLDKLGDDVLDELDSKAYADGYYAQLTAGAADNLTARGDAVEASFIRRTSGGINDIESGNATIETIKGNTVRWNQLARLGAGYCGVNTAYASKSYADDILTNTVNIVNASAYIGLYDILNTGLVGHKLLCLADVNVTSSASSVSMRALYSTIATTTAMSVQTGRWVRFGSIITFNSYASPTFSIYYDVETQLSVNDTVQAKNWQVIDLTRMFGAGNEPSTIAEFEALYPEPYYAYDAGSLKPVKLNGIETTGFNQWDEEWEVGDIDATTGQNTVNASVWRSTNYIPVFPDTTYYVKGTANSGAVGNLRMRFYDAAKNYLGANDASGVSISVNNTFVTHANCRYIRFAPQNSQISDKQVCINLSWSGRRNGEYEPYWKAERLIAAGTHFPTGLKSAGTVYDELTADEAIVRVGEVDLGTLTWTASATGSTGKYRMISNGLRSLIAKPASSAVLGNMTCQKYDSLTSGQVYQLTTGISVAADGDLVVYDPSYEAADSAAAFKTAMSGVILYYALATPTTTAIDPALNLTYKVDDWGTERVMVPSETVSAVPTFGIVYGMNAVDTIRRLPDLYAGKAETEAALAGKADVDGYYSQMTVGAADNLTGRGDTATASFLYRTAGGTADIETGQAVAKSVKGNTLVWNQLANCTFTTARSTSGITLTNNSDGSLTIDGTSTLESGYSTIEMCDIDYVANHKVLIKTGLASSVSSYVNVSGIGRDYGSGDIFTYATSATTHMRITFGVGAAFDNATFYPQLFDLTAMFGSGNEPSTVAEFEALYPLPYYEYDAGSLLSVNMTGIETVGFNQLDPACVAALNNVSESAGTFTGNASAFRVGMVSGWEGVKFFPDMQYEMTFKVESVAASNINPRPYVIHTDGTYVDGTTADSNGIAKVISAAGKTVAYFSMTYSNSGVITISQPCIHLVWSGRRNGEYEAFWKSQRLIDVATYFPDGMRSAGSVYDELTSTEAITRVGAVDLGTLTWAITSEDKPNRFVANFDLAANNGSNVSTTMSNATCSKYETTTAKHAYDGDIDKTIGLAYYNVHQHILVSDSAYTDAASFKTAMSGVILYYALATPTTTAIDPALNLSYRVDDFGTERIMVPEDERSAPPVLDIAYGLNVVDFVRRAPSEYISHASMSQFRLALMAHLGVFINETWDEVDNRYEYTITSE